MEKYRLENYLILWPMRMIVPGILVAGVPGVPR
jgi:hypothetical protein